MEGPAVLSASTHTPSEALVCAFLLTAQALQPLHVVAAMRG